MRIAGLFAGIGGFELGLSASGHEAILLCDVLPQSQAVLAERFPGVEYKADVTQLGELPANVEVITAGFPCQDLSQAGKTAGIDGARSGLIAEVFTLLDRREASGLHLPTLVIENVPFMLQLNGGRAMRAIIDRLEGYGYRWAYRVVDTWAFGLPQRRERVYIVASMDIDPSAVLFADENPLPRPKTAVGSMAHGFYWTEGLSGLGWAVDSVPTLKNGSTIGIASPPAIVMPGADRLIVKPGIEDAEAMQGFPRGWTKPAENVAKPSMRWGLVGSAVSVPVARWVGQRLAAPGLYDVRDPRLNADFPTEGKAPRAARFDGKKRFAVGMSADPLGIRPPPLAEFVKGPLVPLSLKATLGFYSRTRRAKLRFDDSFIDAVRAHLVRMGGDAPLLEGADSALRRVA
jgi:DNA (cytosine-5)-methyltransferase 1